MKIKYDIVMISDAMDTQHIHVISNEKIVNAAYPVLFYGVDSFYFARIVMFNPHTGNVKLDAENFINPIHARISDCRKLICSNTFNMGVTYMSTEEIFRKYDK